MLPLKMVTIMMMNIYVLLVALINIGLRMDVGHTLRSHVQALTRTTISILLVTIELLVLLPILLILIGISIVIVFLLIATVVIISRIPVIHSFLLDL